MIVVLICWQFAQIVEGKLADCVPVSIHMDCGNIVWRAVFYFHNSEQIYRTSAFKTRDIENNATAMRNRIVGFLANLDSVVLWSWRLHPHFLLRSFVVRPKCIYAAGEESGGNRYTCE